MASLLDIFKIKNLDIVLNDNSKIKVFDKDIHNVILYEDSNGEKKEFKISEEENTVKLTCPYDKQIKKRKIYEVPLMDDDLEIVFNRTREQNYELLKSIDYNEFEITSSQIPNDIYRIPYMSKGENKGYAVLVNRTEDAFLLDLNSLFVVKPLSSHIKYSTSNTRYFDPQTPKKEKVVEVPQAPCKKTSTSCSTTSFDSSKKLEFEEKEVEYTGVSSVDIPTDRIVTFIYKGDEKRVLVKDTNDKYTEGICQTDNKYKKYLTRYIEKVNKVEDQSSEDEDNLSEEPQSTYKNMILNTIKTCYVNGTRGLSRQALQAYIMRNYNVKIDNFHNNLMNTLRRLVENDYIVQTKQKFKLGDEGRKYLKEQQKYMKKGKADVKNTGDNKVIQDAIDNEKILDIMYDGGSIPDIKRPIRPKRVYKASNGTQILEAICLIDDKLKKFSLDKVKVVA